MSQPRVGHKIVQNLQEWLLEMEKKDEVKEMEEEHHKLVSRMITSAEGGAGWLHRITKPAMWRGGIHSLSKEEDRRLTARSEEKRKSEHWQYNADVQKQRDKAWRIEV